MLVSCPTCRLEGELAEGTSVDVLGCPRCGTHFPPPSATHAIPRDTLTDDASHALVNAVATAGAITSDTLLPAGSAAQPLTSEHGNGMSVWVGSEHAPVDTPPPVRSLAPELGPYALRSPASTEGEVEVTAENAAAYLDWLRTEIGRFNRFVAQQLDLIQRTRVDMAQTDSQVTAAFVLREQDLNRDKANLAARSAGLDRRQEELATERAKLERRMIEVDRLEASVQRKLEETDEMEETLREELEAREHEIELQRQVVEEKARALRTRAPAPAADDPPSETDQLGSWHCG